MIELIYELFFLNLKSNFMKKKRTIQTITLASLIIFLLASCQKEILPGNFKNGDEAISTAFKEGPIKRAYRDSFDGYLNFVPDIAGGWTYSDPFSLVWWPGGGKGNATHMGNASSYFNQYTIRVGTQVFMFHAPVTMFFGTELQVYNVPTNVSSVVFDDKGNSIWFRNDDAGLTTTRVSPTKVTFTGIMHIVGGTGKFMGATGETTLNGYFNPTDLTECLTWENGWISY